MRFADPLAVVCPSCDKEEGYAPRELVALRVCCRHCSASLESVGREMRQELSRWSGYLAKMDLALELERIAGVEITDADLEGMGTPMDVVQFFRARSEDLEADALAWLTRTRSAPASPKDLQRDFAELFAVEGHP